MRYKSTSRLRNVDLSSALVALVISLSLSLGHVCLCSTRKSRVHAFTRVNIGWYTRRVVHTGAQAIRVWTANRRCNIVANKRRLLTRANQRRLLRVCSGSPVVHMDFNVC